MVNVSSAFTWSWLICCLIFTGTRGAFFKTFWASWLCIQLCPKMEPLSCVLRGKNNHSRTKVIHLSLCQRKADKKKERMKTYFDHWETGLLEAAHSVSRCLCAPLLLHYTSILLACIQEPVYVFFFNDLLFIS